MLGKKTLYSIILVCIINILSPSLAYAEDPGEPGSQQTAFEYRPLPQLQDITLMYPDFPRLSLQCAGCSMTPYTPGVTTPPSEPGIFLNQMAANHLLSWLQLSDSHLRLEVAYAMTRVRNEDTLMLRTLESQMIAERANAALREQALINQRDFALEQSRVKWYEHPAFVAIATGIVTAGATIAITYAVNQPGYQ